VHPPIFGPCLLWPNGLIKIPVGTIEVGLCQDDIVLDGQMTDGRAIAYSEREREFTFAEKGHSTYFLTVSIVAKRLDESRCHLVDMEVGLDPGDVVLDGYLALPSQKGV